MNIDKDLNPELDDEEIISNVTSNESEEEKEDETEVPVIPVPSSEETKKALDIVKDFPSKRSRFLCSTANYFKTGRLL